eukprot:CAMPEP_0118966182 /NCGR_PEP_ID=MMETSP1173-20130426/3682_1 /TAXON_ID=1034831 /ORGANISM="Rhizochromulina marina cf, Strain CCMP1243" /LENGTH=58 /DNA_ID=CAMNT_0006914919 /DNA_START=50 /DNA_END=226 /DNA_ORIENTATION=-
MVKQKHHTGRNATVKAHAKGIKKMPNFFFRSTKGMDPKHLRNMKYAKKYNGKGRNKEE